jgi:Ca2+-binding EF-hand superfamily protein
MSIIHSEQRFRRCATTSSAHHLVIATLGDRPWKILQIFTLVDADGSGQISALEVKHLMHLLGERVDMQDVEALIHEFDLDGSGEVDLTEFIYVLALQRKSECRKKDVMRHDFTCLPSNSKPCTLLTDGEVGLPVGAKGKSARMDDAQHQLWCSAFDLFARGTQTRAGVINKDILEQALLQYGASVAQPKEIQKLVEFLPVAESSYHEFDYASHVSTFLT